MDFETLKMTGPSHDREPCSDCMSFGNGRRKYAEHENDSVNEKTQDYPSTTSQTQYRNAVLEAYGIVPMVSNECSRVYLSRKETKSQEHRRNAEDNCARHNIENRTTMDPPFDEIHAGKGQGKPLKKMQYEQMVLKAYGVLPVKECLSVL